MMDPNTVQILNVERIRKEFPALNQKIRGKPLVYLDSAATALKPQKVIDAVVRMYTHDCANVHRGVHTLSQRATDAYEGARDKVKKFLLAKETSEIVFVRGTTEAINLVAHSFVKPKLRKGDEILITGLEHHSNIVPWQLIAAETGARLVVVPIDDAGEVSVEAFEAALSDKTRFASIAHVSNALGTVLPVREMVKAAHAKGVPILVDGAQAAPHVRINVRDLDCDFYCISGHKVYGPTGAGALYGKKEHLDAMPPWQGGGDMIATVSFEKSEWADAPHKFEAGTPDIAAVVGFGAAVEYVTKLGIDAIEAYEGQILALGTQMLLDIEGVKLIGTARSKVGVLNFVLDGAHPHDIGTVLDAEGVAIRTGHHCAQPVCDRFGVPATARASLGLYSTLDDVEALVAALHKARDLLLK